MKERITVFTPTYNRASLLKRTYESMKRQSYQDFIWLVVDDGSTDNTAEIVEGWKSETHGFDLQYIHKKNGGLQTGYVAAIAHIETELCFCVDSDDYLLDNAIEIILETWDKFGSDTYAGVVAFDCLEDGSILGGMIDGYQTGSEIDILDIDIRKKIRRRQTDRMLIIRTDIYRMAKPAKVYPNERAINATYLHLQIAAKYPFVLLAEPICVVEYQKDGRSNLHNRKKDYCRSPNSYADWRLFKLSFVDLPFRDRCIQIVHYIAECIIAKRRVMSNVPNKLLTMALLPFGWVLSLYLRRYCKMPKKAK